MQFGFVFNDKLYLRDTEVLFYMWLIYIYILVNRNRPVSILLWL